MDGERFDAVTRSLAGGVSRRRVTRGIVGGLAAVGLGLLGRESGAAFICRQGGVLCAKDAQCCSGACVNSHCSCEADEVVCGPRCCLSDQTCIDGQCVTTTTTTTTSTTTTAPPCTPSGGTCDLETPGACCSLTCCNLNPPNPPVCCG